MAKEIVHFRDPHPDDGEGDHAYEEERGKGVVVIKKWLEGHPLESGFLSKYGSKTVVEAVQKSEPAAREFMSHVLRRKTFGNLSPEKLGTVVQSAIECHSGAAQVLMSDPGPFLEMLGQEGMQQALYVAIFSHKSCEEYFFDNYRDTFSRLEVAQEVYLRIGLIGQCRSRFLN